MSDGVDARVGDAHEAAGQSGPARGPRLGVLVPCRNEAAVVARRVANLYACLWPIAGAPHRLVIIDDGSDDDTTALAEEALEVVARRSFRSPVTGSLMGGEARAEVIANTQRPGKAGAIASGLAALGDDVDVVILTDADVVLREDALSEVAGAFARADGPLMVCGSQRFVDAVGDDGLPTRQDGSTPRPAAGLYDRITAHVRSFESRRGLLFSVHGQLLAWSRELDLTPTPGLAADDLDLMLAARARGARIEKLESAEFLEVKTPPGERANQQALRRARAYVQIVRKARWPTPRSTFEALQLVCYRRLPLAAPWLAVVGLTLLALALFATLEPASAAAALAGVAALLLAGPGRKLMLLLRVIATASRVESRESLGDRWEMPRA